MDDMTFEQLLTSRAREVTYPATPPLRGGVMAAIAAPRAPQRSAPQFGLAFAAAAALGVLALTFALPTSRDAVADFFGIDGSNVEPLPTPAPGVMPTPLPTAADIDASAVPATLEEAFGALGFAPALPVDAGEPSAVYLAHYSQPALILRYANFDLWQTRLDGDAFVGKGTTEDATVDEFVLSSGVAARWISGGEHLVQFYDTQGRAIERSQRTVERNTLIWRTDYAFYRIETELPRADAVTIAETLP